ncbi:hypothetical protein AX14_011259 [Amanita brunnescens Koide BX004]|nr:hypothetical protein AX14_011259 [Amanita brunnescens Koide BX004]
MLKLVSKPDVAPNSLFITSTIETDHIEPIAVGRFGRVFRARYGGQLVALKMLRPDSVKKDFYVEALTWQSLSHHQFILPFLGIYKDTREHSEQLFLVSPFMKDGTLSHWRKRYAQAVQVNEIQRLMLEVADGVQYIHSEGMVHGDLHGGNVLLDSEFHCQIIDFGSTRHSEMTVTQSTRSLMFNFAAPELFGICTTCCRFDCVGSHDGENEQHMVKTQKTDVYAFGCLYYTIFFDAVPFHGKTKLQALRLVIEGVLPDRLENPRMEDDTWNVIQNCWKRKPSSRPPMETIVAMLTPPS